MGCAASASLVRAQTVSQLGRNVVDDGPHGSEDSKLPVLHEESADARCDREDDIESLASSAGRTVSSYVSAVTSRHMFSKNYRSENKDDIHSDVPTIAESIADMQDLLELGNVRSEPARASSLTPSCYSVGSGGQCSGSGVGLTGPDDLPLPMVIDNRPHPLAPSMCGAADRMTESSHGALVGDLGVLSDVPSVRDDMSVCSAASEIIVTFPPCGTSSALSASSGVFRSGSPSTTSDRGLGNSTPTSSRGCPQARSGRSTSFQIGGGASSRSESSRASGRRSGGASRRLSGSLAP